MKSPEKHCRRAILCFIALLLASPLCDRAVAESIRIEARVSDGPWEARSVVEALVGQAVSLRVQEVSGAEIRWYRIAPDITIQYNNAVWPWEPNAYQWKGFAEIRYSREEMGRFRDTWEIDIFPKGDTPEVARLLIAEDQLAREDGNGRLALFRPGSPSPFEHSRLGTFWYQAEVERGGETYRTPGIESSDHRGLSPKVLRVSVAEGSDLVGRLTGYFNVPAIFGSVPYQVRHHIGIDCADVIMAAYAKTKGLPIEKDYNVAMLTRTFPTVIRTTMTEGRPSRAIRWGDGVQRGDLVAVKYPGWRQFGHIGALYGDANGNGMLDEADIVIHAGPSPLHRIPLRSGAFDGEIRILRPL